MQRQQQRYRPKHYQPKIRIGRLILTTSVSNRLNHLLTFSPFQLHQIESMVVCCVKSTGLSYTRNRMNSIYSFPRIDCNYISCTYFALPNPFNSIYVCVFTQSTAFKNWRLQYKNKPLHSRWGAYCLYSVLNFVEVENDKPDHFMHLYNCAVACRKSSEKKNTNEKRKQHLKSPFQNI